MRIAFHLAHPAHFYLFRNTILELSKSGHRVLITYNKKDVLEKLIANSDIKHCSKKIYTAKSTGSAFKLKVEFIQKVLGLIYYYFFFRPQLVLGTSVIITLVGRLYRYKSIIVNEDDFDIIQKTAELGYPFATQIVCPVVCRTGHFENKCIKHDSYHELAYLHPSHFTPDISVVRQYFKENEKYCIIRFAGLTAHHDAGIRGINLNIAIELIKEIEPYCRVCISSEKELAKDLDNYRININPLQIHHLMAFAEFYIGDSQTMAAEAGILGIPFIRFNDFVGRISYLKEIEEKYSLGYGISPSEPALLIEKVRELINLSERHEKYQERRRIMLNDKIVMSDFLTWFIENYPSSVNILKTDSSFQNKFRR